MTYFEPGAVPQKFGTTTKLKYEFNHPAVIKNPYLRDEPHIRQRTLSAAQKSLHCKCNLSMQSHKIYATTAISAVAAQLGVEDDVLHKMSIGMELEDGVIWVYGISDDTITAFTDEGIGDLKNIHKMCRRDLDLLR